VSTVVDPHLLRRAEPHFRDAFATYGTPDAHPYDVARRIAEEAELTGFAKPARRKLLERRHEAGGRPQGGCWDAQHRARPGPIV
jgi:hypothetical protein